MNGVLWVILFAVFSFGIWLLSVAEEAVGFQAVVFVLGLLCMTVAFWVPAQLLGRSDRS